MSGATPTIIDRLDHEWNELVRRGTADRALARWRRRHEVLDFPDVRALVAALADRDRCADSKNEILGALLDVAPDDPVAARLVLQRFLPYVKTLFGRHDPFDAEEWVGLLVAIAYEVICAYRSCDARENLTSNLTRDIRRRALRALADRRRSHRQLAHGSGLDGTDQAHGDPFAAVDLNDFLEWAVRRRLVDRATVDLVVRTRVGGTTIAAIAAAGRECAATLRQRRRRAERRLAVALEAVA